MQHNKNYTKACTTEIIINLTLPKLCSTNSICYVIWKTRFEISHTKFVYVNLAKFWEIDMHSNHVFLEANLVLPICAYSYKSNKSGPFITWVTALKLELFHRVLKLYHHITRPNANTVYIYLGLTCMAIPVLKLKPLWCFILNNGNRHTTGIILCMGSIIERRCCYARPPVIGLAHAQNNPWAHKMILRYWYKDQE